MVYGLVVALGFTIRVFSRSQSISNKNAAFTWNSALCESPVISVPWVLFPRSSFYPFSEGHVPALPSVSLDRRRGRPFVDPHGHLLWDSSSFCASADFHLWSSPCCLRSFRKVWHSPSSSLGSPGLHGDGSFAFIFEGHFPVNSRKKLRFPAGTSDLGLALFLQRSQPLRSPLFSFT